MSHTWAHIRLRPGVAQHINKRVFIDFTNGLGLLWLLDQAQILGPITTCSLLGQISPWPDPAYEHHPILSVTVIPDISTISVTVTSVVTTKTSFYIHGTPRLGRLMPPSLYMLPQQELFLISIHVWPTGLHDFSTEGTCCTAKMCPRMHAGMHGLTNVHVHTFGPYLWT